MASIVVRGLEESVEKQLAAQAKEHGCSLEAEVRDILTKRIRRPHIGLALMQAAQGLGESRICLRPSGPTWIRATTPKIINTPPGRESRFCVIAARAHCY